MGKLPDISWRDFLKVAQRLGYQIVRQRGSHIRMRCEGCEGRNPLTLPAHSSLKPGLLRRLIKDAGLTVDEFLKILNT